MNLEGRLLGNRYEILEKIGIGGMATVYKAKCHVLNRYVAVKILRDEFTTDNDFVKRFNTEAQAAASLTHPNIVSIYDVGNEGNLYYIVMELIQGKTLKEIIDEDGALPWKWSINIVIQIASALEAAHRNNIVHRDIKPHNIIITEEGVAKVTDFGIAKAVSNSTITAFGTTIGSVHYFSPEHAKGGYTDAKSDIYSVGVVMFEMLTGKVPFDADTPVSIALMHMQERPIEPIKINPMVPISINKIILKAMQKEPNQRYQTATEMLRDLKQVSKNPNGDFVVLNQYQDNSPTQKIDTVDEKIVGENTKKHELGEEKKGKKQNKVMAFLNKHKALKIILIILLCISVFAGAMGITILISNKNRPKEVKIPNLVGKTIEEVEEITKELKIKYEVEKEDFNKDIEEGKVISQKPDFANKMILENSTIKIVISKGVEMTKVPKVAGDKKDDAIKKIEEAGLKANIIEEKSDKIEEGIVISQEPKEDTEIEKGETIDIVVSLGTGIVKVVVPDTVGSTQANAEKAITDAKLKVTVKTETDMSKSEGLVLKQDIQGGTEIDENSTITITVNKYPEIKTGTVKINLKSLLNYTESSSNTTGNETSVGPKNVKVEVLVNNESWHNENHKENETNIEVSFKGTGTVDITIKVDGTVKASERLDLNSGTPVLNVR